MTEALTAPNEGAVNELARRGWEYSFADLVDILRKMPTDELAKHGITLSEPKDWATELVEELDGYDKSAWPRIIRERVVLKEGV